MTDLYDDRDLYLAHLNELNRVWITNPSYAALAKHTTYTGGKRNNPILSAMGVMARATFNRPPIILIGPAGTGKTTVANLLSKWTGLPYHSTDVLFPARHYRESLRSLWRDQQRYAAGCLPDILLHFGDGVLDFGGGHAVFEDPADLEKVKKILDPYPNVFLLLPSSDVEESLRVLTARLANQRKE